MSTCTFLTSVVSQIVIKGFTASQYRTCVFSRKCRSLTNEVAVQPSPARSTNTLEL